MNHNWERWIVGSIGKAIGDYCQTNSIPLYVEGAPKNSEQLQDWVELRSNGPMWVGGTKDFWVAHIEINVFILSKANQSDGFRILRNIGLIRTRLAQPIPVLKLGVGVDDDQSYLTCLILKTSDGEKLRVSQLGQVTGQTPLMRATVDGMYIGNFEG